MNRYKVKTKRQLEEIGCTQDEDGFLYIKGDPVCMNSTMLAAAGKTVPDGITQEILSRGKCYWNNYSWKPWMIILDEKYNDFGDEDSIYSSPKTKPYTQESDFKGYPTPAVGGMLEPLKRRELPPLTVIPIIK